MNPETKLCPFCGETIAMRAVLCRFCRSPLDTQAPQTLEEVKKSKALLREEPVKEDYLAPHVELSRFIAQKRVCHTCCDLYECRQHLIFLE